MKNFLTICSIMLTIWVFLPLVDNVSIFQAYEQLTKFGVDLQNYVFGIFIFLMSSWFLTLWYSKETKISVFWIIWTLFYLFYFYKIFTFWNSAYEMSRYYVVDRWTAELIIYLMQSAWKHFSIGFFVLLFSFFGNALWMFNVIWNIIKLILQEFKTTKTPSIPLKQQQNNNINNELEMETNLDIEIDENEKNRIIWLFILWNISAILLTIWMTIPFSRNYIQFVTIRHFLIFRPWTLSIILAVLFTFFIIAFLINFYIYKTKIKKETDKKQLLKYMWIWIAWLILFIL